MTGMHFGRGHAALRRGRLSIENQVYHITTTTLDLRPLFGDFDIARAAVRNLNDPVVLGPHRLLAWVLMPDHVHMLLELGSDESLSAVVNRIKTVTARAVNRQLQRSGPVWQRSFHDHALRAEEDLATVGRYIIANPLRAGLVDRVSAYPHWDAIWI
jgi:putative transposase